MGYLLRYFIRDAKQGRAIDPTAACLVADVLERILAGENIGKILGIQAGRPHKYKNAILVLATVRDLMLRN